MFTAAVAEKTIELLLANLPAIISTGEQVFAFVTEGVSHLKTVFADRTQPLTDDDVRDALTKEALQAIQIAALA